MKLIQFAQKTRLKGSPSEVFYLPDPSVRKPQFFLGGSASYTTGIEHVFNLAARRYRQRLQLCCEEWLMAGLVFPPETAALRLPMA